MIIRRGACSCGRLTVTCEGEPIRVSVCHCLACQRRSGGPFGQQARWPEERVRLTGEATAFARVGESGGTITQRFCPTCGSTVSYTIDRLPGFVVVPVGAFADPTFPGPVLSVYEARKHAWVRLPDAIEHLD